MGETVVHLAMEMGITIGMELQILVVVEAELILNLQLLMLASGIVIIRYLGTTKATGGDITEVGGYTIHAIWVY